MGVTSTHHGLGSHHREVTKQILLKQSDHLCCRPSRSHRTYYAWLAHISKLHTNKIRHQNMDIVSLSLAAWSAYLLGDWWRSKMLTAAGSLSVGGRHWAGSCVYMALISRRTVNATSSPLNGLNRSHSSKLEWATVAKGLKNPAVGAIWNLMVGPVSMEVDFGLILFLLSWTSGVGR